MRVNWFAPIAVVAFLFALVAYFSLVVVSQTQQALVLQFGALVRVVKEPSLTVIIPGAKNPDQARGNARASSLPPLSPALHAVLAKFYAREVAAHIRGPY